MNGWRTGSIDMSTIAPMRKPSKMPFFTQVLTRQPVGEDGSSSAARTSPRLSASLKARNSARCSSVYCAGGASKSCSICDGCMHSLSDQPQRFQHTANACLVCRAWRNERKAPDRLQQAHLCHCGFHRTGIRLHEIDFHERQITAVQLARASEISADGQASEPRHLCGNFIGDNRDDAV